MKTKLKILHLEDTPADAELVERELKKGKIQFEKLVVDNKTAFEKALHEFAPDIIISDHKVPSYDSTEAIKIMKQKGIKIPFILVTATISDEFAIEMMKAGADDYILKDRLHRLPQAVLNAMEKFSREKEHEHMIYDNAHLAAIVNASNDGIISKTLDGIITSWNIGAEKLYGYSEAETIGKNISIIIPPDCLQEELEFIESIKRGESVQHFETVRLTKNGTRVDVSLTISPLKDNNGKVIGAAKIVYDITERKLAEQIINDNKEKYHSLFKNSMDGIILTVTDGKILEANPAACNIFKMSEEEICKAGRFGLVDNTDPRVAAAIQERQRTGTVKAELTLIRGNGERFPGEVTSVVYKNAYGEQRTSMIVRDISERKHAQELLIESETFNKGVLSSLGSQIAVINEDGSIISVNKAWDDFAKENGETSLSRVSIGSNYFDVCKRAIENGDNYAAPALDGIQSVFRREAKQFEMEYPCHSLTEQRWFILSAMNFGSDTHKVVISHQNITERKIAENNLSTTSVALQKTLSELNNILDSSLDVICTINANGQFVNVSAASHQVWGYTPEELIGSKFMNLVFDEDADITSKAAEKIISGTPIPIFENRYVHKSGRVVPILWSVNWDEKLQIMYCIAKDVTEKKRLEKAVETERDQFFEMFSKAPAAVGMLKGANHVFEMTNPLYLQFIGKNDVVGKTVAEVLPEVIEQGFVSMLDHVYCTGETYIGKETLVRVDKEENGELADLYMNFVYQAYRNGKGEIEGVFFFINDITEQILSRKEIEKSEKFFKGVIENSDDMILMLDPSGKTKYASPAVSKKFGYTSKETLDLNVMDVIHPDDVTVIASFITELLSHPSVPLPCPLIRERKKDGSYIWIEGTLTNFLEAEGINAIVANFRDVTERKNSDKEIRFKANLLNTIGQAAIATDINGIVNYWNRAAEHIYGWTKEEALGQYIVDLTPSEATNEQAIQIMEALKKGQSWSGEFKVRKKDGTIFPALVTNSPIYDENNILSGIIGISSDITEMKKLEELLEKTNRLAAVGSWEIDVVKGTVFWSDITKEIREVDKDYVPLLDVGISYFKEGIHKETISQKVQDCIENGIPWDEELQIITFKGNHKWVRTIGEGEFLNGKCIRIHGSFQDIDKLKNAEIKIKESEFRYRQIVETAQEGIWMLDENSETTFVNQKMCEIIGYSFDEMMGKTNFFFKDEADLQTAIDALKRRRQGISEAYKASFLTKDGRLIWTQISSNPIFDNAKKYKGSLWMVSDITEKLMADRMLLESEQKYRKLASELEIERTRLVTAQSVAKVGSWETDLQTFQVNWSNETHRIFGSNPEKFEASHPAFLNFIHPEDRKMIDKAFMDSLLKSGSSSVEHRIITLQGIEKWVEENWSVIRDEKGSPMIAVGTCQDITERKKAAEALRISQSNLQAIIENTDATIYSLDTELRYIAFNKSLYNSLKQIYGLDIKIGDNTFSFLEKLEPEEANGWKEKYVKALKGETVKFEKEFTIGDVYNCSSFTIYPIWANKTIIGLSCFVYDITKQKEEQQQKEKMISDIIQRNSDLEQFSYIVSHNLRAPTANIIGFAEILQDEILTPQEQKESLQGLSASVTRLDAVIKDINTILQRKREVHEKKEIVIFSKLVNDIMISIGNLIEKHRVRIISDFSEVDEIYSLKVYIYSIFYNLISNSIKYSKPNEQPLIEIKSKKENGKIILTFKDNGLGIDMKTKGDKIFGLYNRFHSHVEGKGMGLFMVKTQVESLGGKIAIASELNKGTEITIEVEI